MTVPTILQMQQHRVSYQCKDLGLCVTCQLHAQVTYRQGARFTKWRAALKVSDSLPSAAAIDLNAKQLADYAAISQVLFYLVPHSQDAKTAWASIVNVICFGLDSARTTDVSDWFSC